ncbi:MAG: ral stress protein 26 [Myxococcaceae bacterium]|nr:ral stress protein 26 [Myxococcaceae bacterium]
MGYFLAVSRPVQQRALGTRIAKRLFMGQAKQGSSDSAKAQQNFLELLKKFDTAMLVTQTGAGGAPHARPMAVADTSEDGSVWFITGADSPKIDEIRADHEVVAAFSEGRRYLSVSGRAEISRDRARIAQVWKESFEVWFHGKDDPNIVLLRLDPSEAEYWDNSGSQGIKYALKFAAAYVSGEKLRGTDDVNTHGKVQL